MNHWELFNWASLRLCELSELSGKNGKKFLVINAVEYHDGALKQAAHTAQYISAAGKSAAEQGAEAVLVLGTEPPEESSELPVFVLRDVQPLLMQEPARLLERLQRTAREESESAAHPDPAYAAVVSLDDLPLFCEETPRHLARVCDKNGWSETVPEGITIAQALNQCGTLERREEIRAVVLGYPQGVIAKPDAWDTTELHTPDVWVLRENQCILMLLEEKIQEGCRSSCGACVFCREGLQQAAQIMGDISNRAGQAEDLSRLRDLSSLMTDQVNCELGRSFGRLLHSALEQFGEEIELHITRKQCPKGSCPAYQQYYIDPQNCTGCGECLDACEEDAILGKKKSIHIIQSKYCSQCGACEKECPKNAIIKGGNIPPLPTRPVPCGTWKRR